jgi:GntR family transcriptional repressor for pyruvate dehydrogenase complex
MKKIVLTKAYQAVHEALEDAILDGQLALGDSLPTEGDLATQFGVTRHTVREGIRVLEQSGFVKREAGRRLYVTLPRYEELAPRSSRALLMQKVTFRELWQVALQLEVCAAELAASRNSRKLLDSLRANLADMESAFKRGQDIIALDIEFHTLIAEASENRVLLLAREPVTLLFYPALTKLFKHPITKDVSPRRLIEAHRHLVKAFQNRDAAAIKEWMSKHMIDFRRGYEYAGIDIDGVADAKITRLIA